MPEHGAAVRYAVPGIVAADAEAAAAQLEHCSARCVEEACPGQPGRLPKPAVAAAAVPSPAVSGPAAGHLLCAVAATANEAAAAGHVPEMAAVAAEVRAVWQHTADMLPASHSVELYCLAAAAAAMCSCRDLELLQRRLFADTLALVKGVVVATSLQMVRGVSSPG